MADLTFELSLPSGINSDDTTFGATGLWADANNVRFREGRPETIGNIFSNLYTGFGGSVTAMLGVTRPDANYLYVGSSNKLWVGVGIPTGSLSFSDISPVPSGAGGIWSLQMFGSNLLASQSGGKLHQHTGSGVATAVTEAPACITCMIVNGKRQVLALGCNEVVSGTFNGRCIRCSDLEDCSSAGSWIPTSANNSDEIILDGDSDIMSGCTLGDYEIVWTSNAMFLGQFIGDPGQTYRFEKVADVGIVAQKAFAITPGGVYFLGSDFRLYAWAAGSPPAAVACPIFTDFLTNADHGYVERRSIVLGYLASFGEVWIFYPDARDGEASGVNTRNIVFSIRESEAVQRPVWSRGDIGRTSVLDGGALHSILPSWPAATLMGDESGNIHAHEVTSTAGAAPASFVQTSDQFIDQARRRVMVKGVKPDFEYLTGFGGGSGIVSLTFNLRDYAGGACVATKGPYSLTMQASGYVVNGTTLNGATTVVLKDGTGAIAAGRAVTFGGVNEWANGADTGSLRRFTLASDFGMSGGAITLTEPMVSIGAGRNVVSLPADDAAVTVLGTAGKRNFRASGKLLSVKFSGAEKARYRLGKPLFDIVPLGER
jgi:hypothetical protein